MFTLGILNLFSNFLNKAGDSMKINSPLTIIKYRILDFTKAVTRKMAEKRLIPRKFVQNYIMSRAPKPIAVVLCLTIYSIIYVPFKLSNFGEIVLFIRNYFFFLSFLFGSYFASYAALST